MPEIITSPSNALIKQVVKLKSSHARKKAGTIVIEGRAELELALKAQIEINTLLMDTTLTQGKGWLHQLKGLNTQYVSTEIFKKISSREHPDGFLGLAKPRYYNFDRIILNETPLLIVLEAVEKPGNLGAILRTAEAAGVDAVLVCDPRTDIYNPNVIRSSLGTVFSQQIVVCQTDEAIKWLRDKNINVYATTPDAGKNYFDSDFKRAAAIVIGTEHEGLSQEWLEAADEKIKITMVGKIDSLNASVSAAIVVFEAIRQRQLK